MGRFLLDASTRRRIIHGFRLTFEEFKAKPDKTIEGWAEMQAVYRIAEALAEPKRGKRPHISIGYRWYFDNDLELPLRQLEKWEKALT